MFKVLLFIRLDKELLLIGMIRKSDFCICVPFFTYTKKLSTEVIYQQGVFEYPASLNLSLILNPQTVKL